MSMKTTFPILYHTAKKATYSWKVWTEGDTVYTEYGQHPDGEKQIASYKAVGKNTGKANETTDDEQAKLEAKSMWQHKLDRKYRETLAESKEKLMLPMLAHKLEDHVKKIIGKEVYVQPKLDGLRCLAIWEGGELRLVSRTGKPLTVVHIQKQLETLLHNICDCTLDGELYIHDEDNFEDIVSLVKKNRPGSEKLDFHIYDFIIDDDADFDDRTTLLHNNIFKNCHDSKKHPNIIRVETNKANFEKEDDAKKLAEHFVSQGYEGMMIRTANGLYEWGHRSQGLLKVKAFQDAEFKVVGFEEGLGKFVGCVTWKCVTKDGKEFNVTPEGTLDSKKAAFKTAKKQIGKMLKVKFFEYTKDGIPRFPVGIGFRDMEIDG
jgi:DNA ligase 1